MKISFVLPFHNEKENLSLLLPLIEQQVKKENNLEFEINLVDDLYTDGSYEFCQQFIESNKSNINYRLFKLNSKGFQYGALKKGFNESTGEYVICMDTDLQDDPKYIEEFLENIKNNFDIIATVRKKRFDQAPSILLSALRVYDLIFDRLLNKKLKTYRSPFAAYKKKYVENLPWYKNDHRYLIPIAISRGANKITQFEIAYNQRNSGKSHYNRRMKIIFGVIEVIIFIFRMKLGKYKKN